jgi:hypothetical protein
MVFSCAHILATCSYGNGLLVARLRFAGRAAFFGVFDGFFMILPFQCGTILVGE